MNQATISTSKRKELSTKHFIKKTYELFAVSLLVSAVGAYIGAHTPFIAQHYWLFVIIEIALIFGISSAGKKPKLAGVLLFIFAFMSGLTLSTLLAYFISAGAGGLVVEAIILTMLAFGGLSMFAMNTKRDFTSMTKILLISLIIIFAAALLNVFWLHNPIFQVVIVSFSAIIFSLLILHDTQNIIKGNLTPVEGALSLHLDFFNLFVDLLELLSFTSED